MESITESVLHSMQQSMPKATMEPILESTALESMPESVLQSMPDSIAKVKMEPMLESTAMESKSKSELEDTDERREIKSGCSDVRVAIGILHFTPGLPKNISMGYARPPYIISAPEIWACDTGVQYGR